MVGRTGGAAYGLRDWLVQRVSAVFMLAYIGLMVGFVVLNHPLDYAIWKACFTHDSIRLLTALFWLNLCLHAWVGMRDILMDYVRQTGMRLALEALVLFVLVVYLIWAVQILWRV
jgi:succinate dehydrogenase / fumarate reductase membrane anchor subunit